MNWKRYWEHYRFYAVIAVFFLIGALGLLGCAALEHVSAVKQSMHQSFPQARICQGCHIEIYREWSRSAHAHAFTSETYRRATNQYQFNECLGCHTPQAEVTEGTPAPRNEYRDEGVTCASCHLQESRLIGPLGPSGHSPHPVAEASDWYRDSRFCGRCHQGTYAQWQATSVENKRSCQECHMPSVERKLTQANNWFARLLVAMEDKQPLRQHTFTTVLRALPFEPITVAVHRDGEKIVLVVQNHLAHSVPPGDFGVRIVVVEVSAITSSNEVKLLAKYELIQELQTALPPQSSRQWEITPPIHTQRLRVRLYRQGTDPDRQEEILTQEVPLL